MVSMKAHIAPDASDKAQRHIESVFLLMQCNKEILEIHQAIKISGESKIYLKYISM